MHHAPAGPPLSVRLAAALARSRSRLRALVATVRPAVRFVRRTRLVPVLLAGLVIAVFALAAPLPAGGRTPSDTAALTAPTDSGRELVPATGDGWTQDGRPSAPAPGSGAAPADEPADDGAPGAPAVEDVSPSVPDAPAPSVRSAPSPSSARTSAAAPSTSAGPGTTASTTSSDAVEESPAPSSPSVVPSPSSSSVSSVAPSPSSPAPAPSPQVEAPAGDEVLAALNAARTAGGCDPLTEDAGLAGAAAEHSAAMRDQATLLPPPGAGAVAGGLDDPAAVAAGWLADTAVPATDCALTTAGIGVADGWWTLLLA